jgi:transposase
MTQVLMLRSDAEAEAERLRAVRATSPCAHTAAMTDQVPVTTIRRVKLGPLGSPGAIFFARAKVVDASGRVLEELLVPAQVKFRPLNHGKRRRDVRSDGRQVLDRHQPAVVAAVREHVSTRLTSISDQYGRGLARSTRREEHLGKLLAREIPALVQPSLFDRRALKDRESARSDDTTASKESDARKLALQSAVSGITMREPDIVLLLLVGAAG